MKSDEETIVALSTPEGSALRACVRLSGRAVLTILDQLFPAQKFSHLATHNCCAANLNLAGVEVPVSLSVMHAPRSYTSEDMVEFVLLSAPYLIQELINQCIAVGARPAQPGEFTRRAFLRGRIDLTQAEGVLELIHADNEDERKAGLSLLCGGLSARVANIRQSIEQVLALFEASMDFEEGETGHIPVDELSSQMQDTMNLLHEALAWETRRSKGRTTTNVFLTGLPNVGKSSLLNCLDPEAKVLVSPIAGTTRDCLQGVFYWAGIDFQVFDAAGLQREQDLIGQKAQAIGQRFQQAADIVVLVVDASQVEFPQVFRNSHFDILVLNKSDLGRQVQVPVDPAPVVITSALLAGGIDELKQALVNFIRQGHLSRASSQLAISIRHHQALQNSAQELEQAASALEQGYSLDLVAANLRQSLMALDDVTGQTTSEAILDRIFAQFCVGK